jgi:hypothetical protein
MQRGDRRWCSHVVVVLREVPIVLRRASTSSFIGGQGAAKEDRVTQGSIDAANTFLSCYLPPTSVLQRAGVGATIFLFTTEVSGVVSTQILVDGGGGAMILK